MELNWSTFILEIINFLVLVWILKHFLFKPVMDIIARRRTEIERSLADAETLKTDAQGLQNQYESRLADWEQERQNLRETLAREIELERSNRMAELQTVLEQEREKAKMAEQRRQEDAMRKVEETALMQGAQFATLLLKQTSGPDTETRLIEMAINELEHLPAEHVENVQKSLGKSSKPVVVVTAFPLLDEQRNKLSLVLSKLTQSDKQVRFEQNRELLAGIRITIGAWVLGANLQDELKGFVATYNE